VAPPVENPPGLDHQARGVNLTSYDSLGMNFNAPFCEDHSIKFSGNDHVIPFDLSFHSRAFTQDKAMAREQVSLHVGVNAKYTSCFECSFKPHASV